MVKLSELTSIHFDFFNEQGYLLIDPEDDIIEYCTHLKSSLDIFGQIFTSDPTFTLDDPLLTEQANLHGFYKYIRRFNELQSLIGSKTIHDLAVYLGVKIPSLGPSAIRIDISQERGHQFGWHQDAPSLLGSIKMNTYWIPCTDVNKDLGTIEFIPRSHSKLHLKSLDARDPLISPKESSSNLILEYSYVQQLGESIVLNASKGSILIMHPLLVHRSYYPSTMHATRITAILRIDDASDMHHLNLGFKTAVDGWNIFNSPEYVEYYRKYCSIIN